VEALLLWAIKQKEGPDVQRACSALVSKGVFGKSPPSEPLDWNLHQCIETAAEVGLVAPETAAQARLAKDFRNLIHPGRALKKQQDCDRGSALAAQSALELVARDLRVRFC